MINAKELKSQLENAIDEINGMYDCGDANIGWLLVNVEDLPTLQKIAKAIKDHQTEMIEMGDTGNDKAVTGADFDFLITDEMAGNNPVKDLYVIEETYESSAHVLVEATSEKEAKQKYENGDTYEQISAEGDSVLTSSKVLGLAVNHAPHHYKDYVKSKNKDDK